MKTRNNTSTQSMRLPTKQRAISGRGLGVILLLLLVPPVGLLILWYQGIFRARGRMVLTALAAVEMTLLFILITPKPQLVSQLPLPVAPPLVTKAPEGETLTALYNIEELLYQQQLEAVKAQGGDENDLLTEEQKLENQEAEREEILNTVVYAVFNKATRYHADRVCGTQSNNRELTVREAMLEALSPCPDCNPPVWTE